MTPEQIDEIVLTCDGIIRLLTKEYHPGLSVWHRAYQSNIDKLLKALGIERAS